MVLGFLSVYWLCFPGLKESWPDEFLSSELTAAAEIDLCLLTLLPNLAIFSTPINNIFHLDENSLVSVLHDTLKFYFEKWHIWDKVQNFSVIILSLNLLEIPSAFLIHHGILSFDIFLLCPNLCDGLTIILSPCRDCGFWSHIWTT